MAGKAVVGDSLIRLLIGFACLRISRGADSSVEVRPQWVSNFSYGLAACFIHAASECVSPDLLTKRVLKASLNRRPR